MNITDERKLLDCRLIDLLDKRAGTKPDCCAYTFQSDDGRETSLTFAELQRRAVDIAAAIQRVSKFGDRVLLVYPAGLDFVAAFFGCLYAGVIAVPAAAANPRRCSPMLSAIAEDAGVAIVLSTSEFSAKLNAAAELRQLPWILTDRLSGHSAADWENPNVDSGDLALLQYTSGSTSTPRGVMVSHANLLNNLELIRHGFGIGTDEVGVFWLPAYHDMGLIGGILTPLYVGVRSVLLSPTTFLRRPLRWLAAISRHKATISGAPNFAFEMCLEKIPAEGINTLDLHSWRIAFCGAEPIKAETLERFTARFSPCGFRPESFYPCYGLAEATLLAAGANGPAAPTVMTIDKAALARNVVVERSRHSANGRQRVVGCGHARPGHRILIANARTMRPAAPDEVGEVWLKGPSVAAGYWNRPAETANTFQACVADSSDGSYLRTGDLGFVRDGNLFLTGRRKDLIIVRGRNHYPQDIERTVEQSHPALRAGAGAAFSVDVGHQQHLVVVHEIDRRHREVDFNNVVDAVRRRLGQDHELDVHAIVLIRHGTLLRTTSGKVQRYLCREQYWDGTLTCLTSWRRSPDSVHPMPADLLASRTRIASNEAEAGEPQRLAERIEEWLLVWLVAEAQISPDRLDRDTPFAEFGLDSLRAVELSLELEQWLGVTLTQSIAWNYPTPKQLAQFLAHEVGGVELEVPLHVAKVTDRNAARFDELLSDIEALSESEVRAELAHQEESSVSRNQQ